MPSKSKPIPVDIGNYIAIDNSLPSGLVWIKEPSIKGPRAVGKSAGNLNARGYYHVGFRGKKYLCHRVIHYLITGQDPGDKYVDHHQDQSNNDTNLRPATPSQNQYNRKPNCNSLSKYKGVCWNNQRKKWLAKIQLNRKSKNLGYYIKEEDAAYAYNIAAELLFGEYCRLNELPPEYDTNLFQHRDKVIKKANELLATNDQ